MPADTDPIVREARLWTTPMLLTYAQRGALPLHAAAVDIGGQAFVFGGPSRFGKTSLVAAFAAHGHRPLTEDVTCIKLDSKGNHFVVPGPSLLRLRTDVADSLHVPGTRVVARTPERVFLTFEPELRGTSEEVPLGGIVLLRDASERVELTRALGPEVLRDLWALAFRLPIDPDSSRAFSGVVRLADEVAIWDLRRPWELATLLDSVHQIMESLI